MALRFCTMTHVPTALQYRHAGRAGQVLGPARVHAAPQGSSWCLQIVSDSVKAPTAQVLLPAGAQDELVKYWDLRKFTQPKSLLEVADRLRNTDLPPHSAEAVRLQQQRAGSLSALGRYA